jgi:ClpP class serine protease
MPEKARARRTSGASEKPDSASEKPDVNRYILVLYQDPHFSPSNVGSLMPNLVVTLRRDIEDSITEPSEQVEIDVWLESPGGDAHTAYKLAVLLRAYARRLRVVVPDYAKSAATLLGAC